MTEYAGWIIDLYPDNAGVVIWLLTDDQQRLFLHMRFPVTFYAAATAPRLRAAWQYVMSQRLKPGREVRRDLFSGSVETLSITVPNPADVAGAFSAFSEQFPDIDLYDADIPLSLRFAARTGVGILHRCTIECDDHDVLAVHPAQASDGVAELELPLRILELSPDVDPALGTPSKVKVKYERSSYFLQLEPKRAFEISLQSIFTSYDPDLVLTDFGDTWLFPMLTMNPNRDLTHDVLRRKANSYFSYGQVVFRGQQVHLFGRWHIDRKNAVLFKEYGVDGVLQQARTTGIGVQEMARKSPGAGITAMQMLTALRTDVLVPVVKQQAESAKTLNDLVSADRGGMIYQPLVGVYEHVAQIDFASMYPSIMVEHNISPETYGKPNAPDGLIPQTLRPLLEERLAIKRELIEMHPRDHRAKSLKARAAALKWLLVVCFGYLGYKNARFGKIESHEAVTSISRELLLQSKEIAEEMGFLVLHMYVDCLFVQKSGCRTPKDFTPLMEAIVEKTKIAIAMDGIYRWVAFSPSRKDARIPVPNRYFGVFQDGELKYRGIELRRHDTPLWVAGVQLTLLQCLGQATSLMQIKNYLPEAAKILKKARADLRAGRVAVDDLVVCQRISKTVEEYRSLSPTARAARVLQESGHTVAAGQNIRFVYTRGKPGVWPLGTGELDPRWVDVDRYLVLLEKSAESVIDVFGYSLTKRLTAEYVQNSWFPKINKPYEFSLK
jgi:DNA polymerase-2